tara:strand:- start:197 stop:682 length:486 start_codon:yes stop_codon:yes gene_type:complete
MSAKNITDYRNSFSLVPNNLHNCNARGQTFRGRHANVQVKYDAYSSGCSDRLTQGTAKPGPTTDTSSRIARLKKLQKRTRGNSGVQSEGGTDRGPHASVQNASSGTDEKSRRAQLFGYYRNVPGQTSGIGGSSSDVIYFKNVFERMSLNNPPTTGANKGNN